VLLSFAVVKSKFRIVATRVQEFSKGVLHSPPRSLVGSF